jgi:hypothetical protein
MPVLLIILIPLGALVVYAIAFDLRRRRRTALTSHDISSAARLARASADARGGSGLGHSDGGSGGVAPASDDPHVSHGKARLTFSLCGESCHSLPL